MSDGIAAGDRGADETVALHAGPLGVVFEKGALHTFTAHGVEVWRGLMFLYRDATWRTPSTLVHNLVVEADDVSFRLTFDARCCTTPALAWRAIVEGSARGSIRFVVEAQPGADMLSNRTGLCLLHPLSAAGARIDVEHTDGRVSHSTFPTLISPWQPFTNIRGLRHEFMSGCWASCRLDGDVFEMEDQRNFSDASFKTYSGSNLAPRPYRLAAGESITQSATLALERCAVRVSRAPARDVSVQVTTASGPRLPRLGLTLASPHQSGSLHPGHWHVSIDRSADAPETDDQDARMQEAARSASIAIELVLADDADVARECLELALRLGARGVTPESIAVFPTTRRSVLAAREAFPRSRVGGGTPWFFTHLNRSTLPPGLDFITFRTCPIVHVADDRSVMASLSTLPAIIATLRARNPHVPFRIGPASIAMNVNPFASWADTADDGPMAMARWDRRDDEPFAVAWSVGYLAHLAAGGADAVTFANARVYQALAPLAGASTRQTVVADDRVLALAVDAASNIELWLANLTGEPVSIPVVVPSGERRVAMIGAFDCARLTIATTGN